MKRIVLVLAVLTVGLTLTTPPAHATFERVEAPESSQNCTPLLAPVTCLTIDGSGLHVNSFRVQTLFAHEVPVGDIVKGYWRVCNGPCSLSTHLGSVKKSKFVTYTVQGGTWAVWTFTVNQTYANPWQACGQFYDTVPSPYQFRTYRPCGWISP